MFCKLINPLIYCTTVHSFIIKEIYLRSLILMKKRFYLKLVNDDE